MKIIFFCLPYVNALSIVINPFNEYINKILKQIHTSFVNPYIGRMLPQLFINHGLQAIKVLPNLLLIDNFDILSKIFHYFSIITTLINKQELTVSEAQNCIDMMQKANINGSLLYSINFLTVMGGKSTLNNLGLI